MAQQQHTPRHARELALTAGRGLTVGLAIGLSAGLGLLASQALGAASAASVIEVASAETVADGTQAPTPAEAAARKKQLDAMINAAMPEKLWSSLRVVTVSEEDVDKDPAEVIASMVKDHAVLLVMLDPANPEAIEEAKLAQRVMDRYGQHNVRMLGVVPAAHEKAIRTMHEDGALGLMTAIDVDGAFHAHFLRATEAPSQGVQYAMVDHAQVIRSGDLPRRSVRTMLTRVAGERRAAVDQAERDEQQAASGDGAPNTTAMPAGGNPLAVLADDVLPAPAIEYDNARWPRHNPTVGTAARDLQGQALPATPGMETWLTQPVDAEARVIVLDFWATWCGPCIAAEPKLESLQRTMSEDLLIVAVSGQARGTRFPEDESTIRSYLSSKVEGPQYAHAHDPQQRLYRGFGVRAIPHVVVLSTDGIVRWQGNPHSQDFMIAVGQVARVDPGIAARKAGTMARPARDETQGAPSADGE